MDRLKGPAADAIAGSALKGMLASRGDALLLTHQDVRRAESLLTMAARMGRLGAWSVEVPAMDLTWSDKVCAIHGVAPGYKCSVERAIEFYLPNCRDTIRRAFDQCVLQGTPFDLELQILDATGRHVWVRSIGAAERDDDGRIVRVQGAFQDITASKLAAEHNRELAERLSMTLDSLTEGFFTVDRDWRFTFINPQAEKLIRRDRYQLLGRCLWDEFPDLLDTQVAFQYHKAMATNTPVEFEDYYAPLEAWFHVRASPSPQGLAVCFHDITQSVRSREEALRLNGALEERVRERTAELQAANRELEAFSYSVAHDLRGPLSAISGFAQSLQEREGHKLSAAGVNYLQRIRRAAGNMDEMTTGLLTLAKLSRTAMHMERVDISALACEALGFLQARDPARKVQLRIARNLQAEGDRVLLARVFENLLSNAWKFTAKQERAVIEVGVEAYVEGYDVFFVRDNGAGFDMQYASRLFGVFERLHPVSEFEGTGVGLATVQKIITMHKGRIWATSAPGQGATFHFMLGGQATGFGGLY
ncbi:sensor histidine kinase [Ramlibacter albus]|uniref:histidine kinase n=1 Tax=Ramlibacter albus TaxID=2079448 RepID=A0A923S4Y9_9BURK|nr:ATP-binding protein [Ramlibacter albus]MBC5768020.1 PAS domain-containing protein [Ramlibacter albus]